MESPTRIKVAAATTAIAIGGLAGAGIALRSESEPAVVTSAEVAKARPVVIHRKRVKRVPVKGLPAAAPAPAPASSAPATVVATPTEPAVSVPAPESVSSRTSPAGSGGGEYESEDESDDHAEPEVGD